jgi:hypothetical protein
MRFLRKGSLIQETMILFREWDMTRSARDNFQQAKERNSFGARTQGMLNEIVRTISSRFPYPVEVEPLIVLAKGEVGAEIWKACLHWYVANRDELYYRFATEWLFSRYESGADLLKPPDLEPFVREITAGQIASGGNLSEYSITRTARDLLRFGADFGLLTSGNVRQFALHRPPDKAFIFMMQVLLERELNPHKAINAPDWRIYLMSPSNVERELLRLHQFRKLHYQVAGSLVELRLPSSSPLEYAKEISQCLAGKID